MNSPYDTQPPTLDQQAWKSYLDANAAAKAEYNARPIARPSIPGHHYCLCCDILTEQDSTVCLSCQARSTDWFDLAHNPTALEVLRHANRHTPALLRTVIS